MTQNSSINKINIVGAGGHAKVVIDAAETMKIRQISVFDMNEVREGKLILGRTIHFIERKKDAFLSGDYFIVAIGDNSSRKRAFVTYSKSALAVNIIHQAVTVSPHSELGRGIAILSGSRVGPSAVVGDNVIVNTGSIIEHDCFVGRHAQIGPGAVLCGGVSLGEESFVGAGAVVLPQVKVGRRCVVGAGAIVLKDVKDDTVVVGSPARKIGINTLG